MQTSRFLAVALAAFVSLLAPADAQQAGESWLDRVDVFGDTRLRAEYNDVLSPSADRFRARGRFRVGAKVDLGDDLVAGFRLRTGNPEDPNSPHFDLGGTGGPGSDGEFDSWEMNADQVYLSWSPSALEGLTLVGGKFANPMRRNPVYSDLLWDSDVQPEGLQATWSSSQGVGATLGEYVLQERGGGSDIYSTFAQAWASADLDDAGKLDFALGFYLVGDTSPDGIASPLLDDNQGNAVNGAGTDFVSQFGTLNPMVSWSKGDFTLAAEMFNNLRAASGQEDTGFSLGGSIATPLGKFYLNHAVMGQDANFSAWAQDDFLVNSNAVNTVIGWKKPLSKRIKLHVWLMASEADDPALGGPSDMVYRFRTDLDVDLF